MIRKIVLLKFYIARSASWLSLINSGMILYLVLDKIQAHMKLGLDVSLYFPIIYVTGIFFMIVLGFIDDKLQCTKKEQEIGADRSPWFTDIINRLERIENK
jgi:hypothetical protein